MKTSTECACTRVRRAARAVTELYDECLEPSGLRVTQYALLRSIERSEPANISTLAEAAHLDRTTLGRNLNRLRAAGLVTVSPGADQRERTVRLTSAGELSIESAMPLWRKAQAKIRQTFEVEELATLMTLLSRFE